MSIPFLLYKAAIVLSDADDLVSGFMHELRGIGTNIAEALHDHARAFAAQAHTS